MRQTAKLIRVALVSAALCALCIISAAAASYGAATVNADALRLRATASTEGTIMATAPGGAAVVVLEDAKDGWYKVDYKTQVGYMSSEYLAVSTTLEANLGYGVVDTDGSTLNLRSEPNTTSSVLAAIPGYVALKLDGINAGWYKVTYNDNTGYVSSDYIRLAKDETGARNDGNGLEAKAATAAAAEATGSSLGAQAVAIAKQQLGKPYVSGAKGPNAFDCSGFIYYVYRQLGYTLSGGSSTQFRTYGTAVSFSDLQPGDLYFIRNPRYSGGNATSHVGIYIGGGQFIHASTSGSVTIDSIYSSGYDTYFVGGRRIG